MSEYCLICSRIAQEHHLIFGNGRRPLSDSDKLVIPLCSYHHTSGPLTERIHDNPMAEYLSKALGQSEWERKNKKDGESDESVRQRFINIYGRSWL